MNLREQYLQTVRDSQRADRTKRKQLVSRGADAPPVYAIHDGRGDVIGFTSGPAEPIPLEEVRRVESLPKLQPVSKSAPERFAVRDSGGRVIDHATVTGADSTDPNAVFDSFPFFASVPDERSEVAKSVHRPSPDDSLLSGLFPQWLRST